MIIEPKTKRYFTCPNGCSSREFFVEHLLTKGDPCAATKDYPTRTAGPWYCDDCGDSWNIAYTATTIDVTRSKQPRQIKQHVVLEIPPLAHPIRFRATRSICPEYAKNTEYSYESHSCPTNWLREIDTMEFDGDQDPHGVIRFVNQFEATPETLDSSNSQQPSLFTVEDVSTGEWR